MIKNTSSSHLELIRCPAPYGALATYTLSICRIYRIIRTGKHTSQLYQAQVSTSTSSDAAGLKLEGYQAPCRSFPPLSQVSHQSGGTAPGNSADRVARPPPIEAGEIKESQSLHNRLVILMVMMHKSLTGAQLTSAASESWAHLLA